MLIFEMAAGYPPFYSENKVEIFRAICAAQYTFPEHFTKVLTACYSGFWPGDWHSAAKGRHSTLSAAAHLRRQSVPQVMRTLLIFCEDLRRS